MKHLLVIPSIMNEDWARIKALLAVVVILYACVFLSVLIDLFFGVKRAKRLNIVRTSLTSSSSFAPYQNQIYLFLDSVCRQFGYRRTITKLTSYLGLMLMLSIADIAASIVFKMPYFTVVGAIGMVMVKARSVFENIKHHEKGVDEIPKNLLKLFENREEIKSLITFLNDQTPKKP